MRAVYSPDCSCWLVEAGCASPGVEVERYGREYDACVRFRAHLAERERNSAHRYWLVHGPSGHVIAVKS